MKLSAIWNKVPSFLKNKYAITIIVFLVWLALFDQNSFLFRHKLTSRINNMKKQKELYEQQIKENKQKIEELKGSPDNLEKFAREEYLMKKENEVIFIVKEE
jgi:cell division protein FtsB